MVNLSFAGRSLAAASLISLAVLAGCSDSTTQPRTRLSPSEGINAVIIPTLSDAVVQGSDLGAFTNPINPTEATRVTGAFWDNLSSDDSPPPPAQTSKCNVGFYVIGTIGSGCLLQTPGSFANKGGAVGGAYWGDGAGSRDASSFTFNGKYSWAVVLKGSYAGGISEVGWFTKDGTGYHFHAVADWGNKVLGTTATISTGGANWGFYVKNSSLDATGNCAPQTSCSDATGGFTAAPFNQFALFVSADGNSFMVGTEDNKLSLWTHVGDPTNPTNADSDYNDYIFSVVPSVIPGHCTYTKGWYRNHGSNTVTALDGRSKTDVQAIFDATPGQAGNVTWQGGNDVLNLYQQLLAALLNGGTSGPTAVQTAISQALAGTGGTGQNITTTLTQTQVSDLTDILSSFNEGSFAGFPHCQ